MDGSIETLESAKHAEAERENGKHSASPRGVSAQTKTPGPNASGGQPAGATPTPAPLVTTADFERALAAQPAQEVTLQTLLQAGVHFGHQTSRWHPQMGPFIHSVRNGIHIISLPKTVQNWERARKAIIEVVSGGGDILFVGTKKQAQEAIVEEAKRCGAYYVSQRWLGGMMTNFQTIRKSIDRMKKVEALLADEEQRKRYTKKELLMLDRERIKLEFSLGGIKDMHAPPDILFVVDIRREDIAIKEAKRLDIPVVALVDTNCDPGLVEFPIPSNDDATRAIKLFAQAVADAVLEGKKIHAARPSHGGEHGGRSRGQDRDTRSSRRRGPKKDSSVAGAVLPGGANEGEEHAAASTPDSSTSVDS